MVKNALVQTRQSDLEATDIAEPKTVVINYLNNKFDKVDDIRELIISLIGALYNDESTIGKKILEKYRSDCRFKNNVRLAFSTALGASGVVVSNMLNKECKTNGDRVANIVAVASALSYSVGAVRGLLQ